MPTRPRQHILEDLAHVALRRKFAKFGWTTENLSEDYGEDFLIRIFNDSHATPFSFYVQSKATDRIDKYRSKDLTKISYPIETGHIRHWERFWEPVVLCVYDAASANTYWRVIQPWLEGLTAKRRHQLARQGTSRVAIPTTNLLDDSGLNRLHTYTEQRFYRFQREQDGASHLVDCLKESINLEIDYNAQKGVLIIPNGAFQKDREGGAQYYFFGKTGAMLCEIAESLGIPEDEAFIRILKSFQTEMQSKKQRDKKRRNFPSIEDA